jgi:hypothetical protein
MIGTNINPCVAGSSAMMSFKFRLCQRHGKCAN